LGSIFGEIVTSELAGAAGRPYRQAAQGGAAGTTSPRGPKDVRLWRARQPRKSAPSRSPSGRNRTAQRGRRLPPRRAA